MKYRSPCAVSSDILSEILNIINITLKGTFWTEIQRVAFGLLPGVDSLLIQQFIHRVSSSFACAPPTDSMNFLLGTVLGVICSSEVTTEGGIKRVSYGTRVASD